jgi:DNA repair protein RadC
MTVSANGSSHRLTDLPTADRPRERLSSVGVQHLADRELLAMVLGTGTRGMGAHLLAEQLLTRYGSVLDLARAHYSELAAVPGIGVAKAAAVASAFELARRVDRPVETMVLRNTLDLRTVVNPLLNGRTRERLVLVTCDAMRRVTNVEVLIEGAADSAILPHRDILVAVLRRDGQAFALAHNHPSGNPVPSEADIESTLQLYKLALALDVEFLEHIVISDAAWSSVPMPKWPEAL